MGMKQRGGRVLEQLGSLSIEPWWEEGYCKCCCDSHKNAPYRICTKCVGPLCIFECLTPTNSSQCSSKRLFSERSDHPFPPHKYKPVQFFQPKPDISTKKNISQQISFNKKKYPPSPPFAMVALLPLLKALTAHAHALGACVKGMSGVVEGSLEAKSRDLSTKMKNFWKIPLMGARGRISIFGHNKPISSFLV